MTDLPETLVIEVEELRISYGSVATVGPVSFTVRAGQQLTLLGPSGCGKTTTLRAIAGLEQPSTGLIRIAGQTMYSSDQGINIPAEQRGLSMVFQSYAIWPHMTVFENVAYGLRVRRKSAGEIREKVHAALDLVQMGGYAERSASQLSGGQQQRVALARALAINPRVLLLDEPLSNLDASLRAEVGRDIRLLQRDAGLTTIMVTHDQDEAMAMADRLVVMRDGQVQQTGTQEDLYERPATPFVASFIGRSTMLEGRLSDGKTFVVDGTALHLAAPYAANGACTLALRPERLWLEAPGVTAPGAVAGTVELASYLGPVREHLVRIGPDTRLLVRDSTAAAGRLHASGEAVSVRWDTGAERVFDAALTPLLAETTTTTSTRMSTHV
jgi:putative spermidine/putrescine transport system ATP-binding protein